VSDGEEEKMFFLRRSRVRGHGEGVLLENSGRIVRKHVSVPAHLEKKIMTRIGLYGLGLLVVLMQGAGQLHAADPKGTEKEKAAEKSGDMARALPFVGTVSSVDLTGHTFALNGKAKERVFKVTDKTEILMDGKPVSLNAMTVGAKVQGSAMKYETDWEARKVTIGAKETSKAQKK
jgi:hypothetical protein